MYSLVKKLSLRKLPRRSFSSNAFGGWNPRMQSLCKKYPRLFNRESFVDDQTELLRTVESSLPAIAEEYEKGRNMVNKMIGDDLFPNVNGVQPQTEPVFSGTYFEANSVEFEQKLMTGESIIADLLALQQKSTTTVEESNLQMIAISDFADKIDEWRLSLLNKSERDSSSDLFAFPISDQRLDAWVTNEYYHAPDHVREQGLITYEEHKILENEWMQEVDERLVIKLKNEYSVKGMDFDENAWKAFCKIANDIFHPHNIDHYVLTNPSKSLFRAALWQSVNDGSDRPSMVEDSILALKEISDDTRDNDCEIVRRCYEQNKELKYASLVRLQLQITDPMFAAKICDEARLEMERVAFERAVKDVMRDLEIPSIEEEKRANEEELRETMSSNPINMQRNIRRLENEAQKFNIEVPDLETVLDSILPIKLWTNDISGVKSAIIAYASDDSSVTLSDIHSEIVRISSSNVMMDIEKDGGLTAEEITKFSVDFHNARESNPEWWNLKQFLVNHCNRKRDQSSIVHNQRTVKRKLHGSMIDPLVSNLICFMIADGKCDINSFHSLLVDYQTIMRKYRGEVDAVITSAQSLDENTFKSILMALENANPDKKITLEQTIDTGVQAGFIVKAGLQKFDFSLATHLQQAL